MFSRSAFELSDADLSLINESDEDVMKVDSDDEPLKLKRRSKAKVADSDDEPISNLKGKGKAKTKKFALKRPLRKRKAIIVLDWEEEMDSPEQEVIFDRKKKMGVSGEPFS